jgi:hypothetical protein
VTNQTETVKDDLKFVCPASKTVSQSVTFLKMLRKEIFFETKIFQEFRQIKSKKAICPPATLNRLTKYRAAPTANRMLGKMPSIVGEFKMSSSPTMQM